MATRRSCAEGSFQNAGSDSCLSRSAMVAMRLSMSKKASYLEQFRGQRFVSLHQVE